LSYAGQAGGVHYIADEEHAEGIDAQSVMNVVAEVEALIRGSRSGELEEYLGEIFDGMRRMKVSMAGANYLMVQLLASVCKILYAVADGEEIEQIQKNTLLQSVVFQDGSFHEMQVKLTEFCLSAWEMIGSQTFPGCCEISSATCESTIASSEPLNKPSAPIRTARGRLAMYSR